jgi:hypothetical protein
VIPNIAAKTAKPIERILVCGAGCIFRRAGPHGPAKESEVYHRRQGIRNLQAQTRIPPEHCLGHHSLLKHRGASISPSHLLSPSSAAWFMKRGRNRGRAALGQQLKLQCARESSMFLIG